MKRDNVNYVLVGVVVAIAFVLLIVALALITGRSGVSTSYYTHYHNVTGLRYGAPVFYEGYRIGQVGSIEPERDARASGIRYRVELAVRRDWPIPKDSLARLTATGLLADVAIGISEGSSKEAAAPGSELRGAELADIFSAVNELAAQLTELTRDQIAPMIKSLSQHVDSIASVIDKNTPELVEQSKQLLHRLNSASDSLDDLLKPENRAAASAILVNVRDLSHDLRATQDQLKDVLEQVDSVVRENRPAIRDSVADLRATLAALSARIDSITQHLAVASRNFDEFSHEIRKHPNSLLLAPKADKLEGPEQ
ncbi:MAG TPA: MlaD family protein [Rudaea sp.]|nr:MlaD family protein [Rudaea sp.]